MLYCICYVVCVKQMQCCGKEFPPGDNKVYTLTFIVDDPTCLYLGVESK